MSMDLDITHCVNQTQARFTSWGMEPHCARRNMGRMQGNRLKQIRAAMPGKPSQSVIAEALGLSTAQISRWEAGEDSIPSFRLPSLAIAYCCTIGEIFEDAVPSVSADDLDAMLDNAQQEIPPGTPFADWRRAAAASVHTQLEQLRADRLAVLRRKQETAPDKVARSPAATRRAAQG